MIKITASQYGAVVASILGFALLTGCKKPTTDIGLEFAQEDLLGLHQTDTLALTFETVREDSLETSHLSTAVLGNMEHPFFGMHQGSFAVQLRLSAPDIDFGVNPVVDSIYLSLNYTGDRYGELSPQNIRVEQLIDSLTFDSAYYSNQVIATTEINLADPGYQPVVLNPRKPFTSVAILSRQKCASTSTMRLGRPCLKRIHRCTIPTKIGGSISLVCSLRQT